MSYQVDVAQPKFADEIADVFVHGRHGVVLDPLGVIRIALPEPIEDDDVSPQRQVLEISTPVRRTIGAEIGAKIAAMQKDHCFALAFLEIARPDAVYVDKFLIAQWHACSPTLP